MYKGHKLSKRLKRYIGYARAKYHKARLQGTVDLWSILIEYELIASAPYCVQMYIYDVIEGRGAYEDCYEIVEWINGGVYIREVVGAVA